MSEGIRDDAMRDGKMRGDEVSDNETSDEVTDEIRDEISERASRRETRPPLLDQSFKVSRFGMNPTHKEGIEAELTDCISDDWLVFITEDGIEGCRAAALLGNESSSPDISEANPFQLAPAFRGGEPLVRDQTAKWP